MDTDTQKFADENVEIFENRAVFGDTAYSLKNIKSVKVTDSSRFSGFCSWCIGFGILFFMWPIVTFTGERNFPIEFLGAGLFALGMYLHSSGPRIYHIRIESGLKKSRELSSPNKEYVEFIAKGIPALL